MKSPCSIPINTLPVMTTCPSAGTYFVVIDSSIAPYGAGLLNYRQFIQSALEFEFMDFVVGNAGAPMVAGQNVLVINQANIIFDSIQVILGGVPLARNDNTQISYTVIYTYANATITLNQGVYNGQQYVITYAFSPC